MQTEPERFARESRALIEDLKTELFFSAASSWEIAIKYALGRLALPLPPHEYVPSRLESSGMTPLPVQHSHALRVAALPAHHRDPFDRLLIAQAQVERLVILTADRQFMPYDVRVQWAD